MVYANALGILEGYMVVLHDSLSVTWWWWRGLKMTLMLTEIPPIENVAQTSKSLTSSFVFSAIILWKPIPTPSMTAKKHAHMMAEFRAALTPPRTARQPPVKKPAMTVSYGS